MEIEGQSAWHKVPKEPFYLMRPQAPTDEARMDDLEMKSAPTTLANPDPKEKD